jgi:hypothetical protein
LTNSEAFKTTHTYLFEPLLTSTNIYNQFKIVITKISSTPRWTASSRRKIVTRVGAEKTKRTEAGAKRECHYALMQ